MITENLSTLKIHKLTKAQYDRESAAGTLDPTALYLTPDESADLSEYITKEELLEPVMETVTQTYTWDGDYNTSSSINGYLKVSDNLPNRDTIEGSSFIYSYWNTGTTYTDVSTTFVKVSEGAYKNADNIYPPVLAVYDVPFTDEGITVTEPGLYFFVYASAYVNSITLDVEIESEVKKIKEEYLPTNIGNPSDLTTTNKTVVGAINELKSQVLVDSFIMADAITGSQYKIQIQNGQLVSFPVEE